MIMMRMSSLTRKRAEADKLPRIADDRDIALLLREIESEEIPERLLDLAHKLQDALAKRRRQTVAEGAGRE